MPRVEWKLEQAELALQVLLNKMTEDIESINYRVESTHNDGVKYIFKKKGAFNSTELEIYLYSKSKNMWMGTYTNKSQADGGYKPSILPWKDKKYKSLRKSIVNIVKDIERRNDEKREIERRTKEEENRDNTFLEAFKEDILAKEMDNVLTGKTK